MVILEQGCPNPGPEGRNPAGFLSSQAENSFHQLEPRGVLYSVGQKTSWNTAFEHYRDGTEL